MTGEEAILVIDLYGVPMDENEFKDALMIAEKSISNMEKMRKQVEALKASDQGKKYTASDIVHWAEQFIEKGVEDLKMNNQVEVKMVKFEGHYVPEELCTVDREGGVDDFIPCQESCIGVANCESCVVTKVFDAYARASQQDIAE